jgi:hypothetical protein
MGLAWIKDRQRDCQNNKLRQEIHYLSSYRTRDDAILRIPVSTDTNSATTASIEDIVKETLFISEEKTKLTPTTFIDYLTSIIENSDQTNTPEDVAVFICGTPAYSQMIKDTCAIVSAGIKYYEW